MKSIARQLNRRENDTEMRQMMIVGSVCGIQLAIKGMCLRTDTLHLICNFVSLGAIKRAWCVQQDRPCISML